MAYDLEGYFLLSVPGEEIPISIVKLGTKTFFLLPKAQSWAKLRGSGFSSQEMKLSCLSKQEEPVLQVKKYRVQIESPSWLPHAFVFAVILESIENITKLV